MVQLINVSSADCDICNLPGGTPQGVESLLQRYGLDGIEFMVCDAKDTGLFPRRIVRGIHLWFYPSWRAIMHQSRCAASSATRARSG